MKINITTPICSTSYGYVGQNLIKSFIKQNVDVSLRVIGNLSPDSQCGYDIYINKCQPEFIKNAPHIIIWHAPDIAKYNIKDSFNIGFPIFELDKFNNKEIENLQQLDKIFTPSNWSANILRNFVQTDIDVIPLGVDQDVFVKNPYKNNKITFLSMGKWEVRKNQLAVAKAFGELFFAIPDVSLSFFCHNDFFSNEENLKWQWMMKKFVEPAQLSIFPSRLQSHQEIAAILNQHSIGVFPSLAEGWNLELHEMLYLNKQCIATNYSGHTEFATKDNCYLIDTDELEDAWDFKWFFGQGRWAKWSKKQHDKLKELMWKAYSEAKLGLPKPNNFDSINKLTWDNSVNCILQSLKGVL